MRPMWQCLTWQWLTWQSLTWHWLTWQWHLRPMLRWIVVVAGARTST
jgi:hypothetical protein